MEPLNSVGGMSTLDTVAGHAVFDFDKTLTTRDSLRPFLRLVAGTSDLLVSTLKQPITALMSLYDSSARDRFKQQIVAEHFKGLSAQRIDEVGLGYANEVLANWLRDDVVARLRWHQELGHITSIVSASLNPYMAHVARQLAVDNLCCTELEVLPSGLLSGRFGTPNCRRSEKVRRIEVLGITASITYAYGDSSGDHEMLRWADVPTLVGRSKLSC